MAKDKKSFILYADSKDLINALPDDVAGRLLKHIFAYVNDENPHTDEILLNVAFAPIKAQLKRDLKKYEGKKKERSNSGILGNLSKYYPDLYEAVKSETISIEEAQSIAKERKASHSDTNTAVSDSVNDNVSDSDILLKKETKNKKFDFKKSLIALGIDSKLASEWLQVRSKKKAVNTETAFNGIKNQIDKSGLSSNDCAKIAVERSWSSFNADWIKNTTTKSAFEQANDEV